LQQGFFFVAEADQISNLELINDIAAIIDFIEEMHIILHEH